MSTGGAPLLPSLNDIRHTERDGECRDREYSLGCRWTSYENWVEIAGLADDDIHQGVLTLPDEVARKIAAAVLMASAQIDGGDVGPEESRLSAALDGEDQAAFRRVLQRILAAELTASPPPPPKNEGTQHDCN